MCVLCLVKGGNDLPKKEVLWAMHKANPHGMGFASKSVHYKGMNFETFYNRLQFVPKNENIIIHFRFATHGSVCAQNCHPFKKGNIWFAHNGILDIMPEGDMTDSETAFRNILYPVAKEHGIFSEEMHATVDEIIGGSKFILLDKKGNAVMFGKFYEYNGMLCSNLNWTHYLYQPQRFQRSWYACG